MFLLFSITALSFLFGFAFPPLWIVTLLALRGIVRLGRSIHAERYEADQLARTKAYLAWTK